MVIAVEPDGTVASMERTMLAGLKGFDDAPVDLIHHLGKLPPPPESLRSDDGRVHVRWRFLRKVPGCEEATVFHFLLPIHEAVPRLILDGKIAAAVARIKEAPGDAETKNALLTTMAEAVGRLGATRPEPRERVLAAGVLARTRDGEAPLLSLTADKLPEVRHAALQALLFRAPSPVTAAPLKKLLATGSAADRAGAARLLHRLGDDSGVQPLHEALPTAAPEAALAVATALKELGEGPAAAKIAARMLADPAQQASGVAAALALGDPLLADPVLRLLTGAPTMLRREILKALAGMAPKIPAEGKKAVLRGLNDPDPEVRAATMRAAAVLGDKSTTVRYRLVDGLADASPAVRAAAATALVSVGGEATRDELVRAARDKVLSVRLALYQALKAHPVNGTAPLLARLSDDRGIARRLDTGAGQLVGDETGVDELPALGQRLLDTEDPVGRLQAASAWLARVRDARTADRASPTL